MPCTTILVGKGASYDGSTIMARNEDCGPGRFTTKKFKVVNPDEQPRVYRSVISGAEIPLPDDPMRYTSMPNADPANGVWGEAGVNSANVAMSETETITSNPRVLGADPLVGTGIGEEDFLTLVLPYIRSAKEGVLRLAKLLEEYGTYEMNGIGFQDVDEIWWMETVGGHHWIARRVPDDSYAVGPNQLGIDILDLSDAFGDMRDNMCSGDLISFIRDNHLDLRGADPEGNTEFDVRAAFGSRTLQDHLYNTPRAWYMERYFNPETFSWDGPDADFTPESDDIPWCLVPERLITVEDVKNVLSSYYEGTPYDVYSKRSDPAAAGKYRPIGINRNNFVAITQLRPYVPAEIRAVEWISEASNAFNCSVPLYANVTRGPAYTDDPTPSVHTGNLYWDSRLIGALADAHYGGCVQIIDRYREKTFTEGHRFLNETDKEFEDMKPADVSAFLEDKNEKMADKAAKITADVLGQVLNVAYNAMKNAFSRSDS